MNDQRVGTWEKEFGMVALAPFDDVGRLPALLLNLDDDTLAVRLASPMPSYHNPVTNFCEHGTSVQRPHLIVYIAAPAVNRDRSPDEPASKGALQRGTPGARGV